ncbi:hypothetical protein PUP68_21655 [Pseudomonas chlororaphis]|uniref:hypothetical protein n=1 Tax=Pseudomonas chlororaphis TaxID=587753 RepID=UPI0023679AAA|nr:hypothetical protein [Pseudomonas chlororaphis]WDG77318.1 hypothetical protein PUP77_23205 [Pseudomonas chlororaphis]WDG83443.1 hypothetical protein PUP68_21655 [Pseudomonas chlororaphis]
MKKDWVIWTGCILLFFTGAIWGMIPDKSGFFAVENVHDLFDMFGAIATAVAASVGVIALTNWQSQFRHAEKYKALKDLKDAAYGLHAFRGYLFAVQRRCLQLMAAGGVPNEAFDEDERIAHEQWTVALRAYNVAWGTAIIFLTGEEEAMLTAPAYIFTNRTLDDPLRIVTIYANAPGKDQINNFNISVRKITDDARLLSATAMTEAEILLRQNFRSRL